MTQRESTALLRRTLEYIEAHPEEHDQRHWAQRTACGTTMCIAGTAVMLGIPNAEFAWGVGDSDSNRANQLVGVPVTEADEWQPQIERLATELLELDEYDVQGIFFNMDDFEALQNAWNLLEEREAAESAPDVE